MSEGMMGAPPGPGRRKTQSRLCAKSSAEMEIMMSDYMETDTGAMERDSKEMEDALRLVRQDMKRMFEAVEELGGTWSGPANIALTRQFQHDEQTLEALCRAVGGIIDSMKNAGNAYRKCEAGVGLEIDRIQV